MTLTLHRTLLILTTLAVVVGANLSRAVAQSPPVVKQTPGISAPAQVKPYETARIFAKASGFVSVVHVDLGDSVKKGQLLAELSIPEMEQELLRQQTLAEQAAAAVRQAEAKVAASKAMVTASGSQVAVAKAQLEKHRADIEFAQSELTRITSLVSSRAVNAAIQDEKQQQLRAAKAALGSAEAEVQSAESNRLVAQAGEKLAEADLAFAQSQRQVTVATLAYTVTLMDYAKIHAPFDGTISHRGIDTGDFVTSAASSKDMEESLFTLHRVDRFRIVFDVPESAATRIQPGQKVELKVDSVRDHVFKGDVKRTTGELDVRTRTLRVEAEITDDISGLLPGMYGAIQVIDAPKPKGTFGIGDH